MPPKSLVVLGYVSGLIAVGEWFWNRRRHTRPHLTASPW